MKNQLLPLLLMLISVSGFAQYLPIATPGRVWYVRTEGQLGVSTRVMAIEGDTLVSGKIYPLLVEKDASLATVDTLAIMMENTQTGLLQIKFLDTSRYDQYYNMGAQQGDSINYVAPFSGDSYKAHIDSIYTFTDVAGINRRAVVIGTTTQNFCGPTEFLWIEGIGSAGSIDYPVPECSISDIPNYILKCVFDDSVKIYGNVSDPCFTIGQTYYNKDNMSVYPNPVASKMRLETGIPIVAMKIYDSRGMLIKREWDVLSLIDVSFLKPGIYLLEVETSDGSFSTTSFIRQ